MEIRNVFVLLLCGTLLMQFGCKEDDEGMTTDDEPKIVFQFKFDSTQQRLNNFGQPASMPAGHAGQSPRFNSMSAHYVELAPSALTWLGDGEVLYKGPETTMGGDTAIDFDQEVVVGEEEPFLEVPLSEVTPGTYEYLRVSLAYQNYDVDLKAQGFDLTGTLASFVGYNTYIKSFKVKDSTVTVNANKLQGYWAFETQTSLVAVPVQTGEAPATTVVNPIFSTSPIPSGSCVVTGSFSSPLEITGNETENIIITVSLSTNKSFEWKDNNANGIWEPLQGENVVDMGLRGLEPKVELILRVQ